VPKPGHFFQPPVLEMASAVLRASLSEANSAMVTAFPQAMRRLRKLQCDDRREQGDTAASQTQIPESIVYPHMA